MSRAKQYLGLWVPSLVLGLFIVLAFGSAGFYAHKTLQKHNAIQQQVTELRGNLPRVIGKIYRSGLVDDLDLMADAMNTSNTIQDQFTTLGRSAGFDPNPYLASYRQMYKHLVMAISFAHENRPQETKEAMKVVRESIALMEQGLKELSNQLSREERDALRSLTWIMVLLVFLILALSLFNGLYLIPRLVIQPMERASLEIQKREEKYRIVADFTHDWEYWLDPARRYLYLSPSVERITGYPVEAFLEHPNLLESIMLEEDKEQWIEHGNLAHHPNRPEVDACEVEFRIRTKAGEIRVIDHICRPVYDRQGHNLGVRVTNRDITARKRAEEELRALSESLAQQVETEVASRMEVIREKQAQEELLVQHSKMAAMGEMIGAIAHQWKQPLNGIALIIQDLPDQQAFGELNEESAQALCDKVMEQIQFMTHTIDDFRNFFKPSKEIERFIACETIITIHRMFQDQFKQSDIEVVIHPHEHFEAVGYPNEFKQVILNLLNNAKDVILEKGIKEGRIDCYFEHTQEWGIIRIRDNGGGIPDTLLPDALFDPYVSTKGEKGTGIGLSMSKTIIEKHMGGKLWAHNVEGGAEFVIELPLAHI